MLHKKNGFTLMELLAVVLIIAVLVSVSAPQYKTAVMRMKYLKLQRVVRKVMAAEQRHLLATGTFTTDLDMLDIEFPPWKLEHKLAPDADGRSGAAYYGHDNGEVLVLKNTPNYFEIRMRSDELPVSFEMYDWHYPNMAINPDVMKEHLIESYCKGDEKHLSESRRLCSAFGASVNKHRYHMWKF